MVYFPKYSSSTEKANTHWSNSPIQLITYWFNEKGVMRFKRPINNIHLLSWTVVLLKGDFFPRLYFMSLRNRIIFFLFHDSYDLYKICSCLSLKRHPHNNWPWWDNTFTYHSFSWPIFHINIPLTENFKFGHVCLQHILPHFQPLFLMCFVHNRFFLLIPLP